MCEYYKIKCLKRFCRFSYKHFFLYQNQKSKKKTREIMKFYEKENKHNSNRGKKRLKYFIAMRMGMHM